MFCKSYEFSGSDCGPSFDGIIVSFSSIVTTAVVDLQFSVLLVELLVSVALRRTSSEFTTFWSVVCTASLQTRKAFVGGEQRIGEVDASAGLLQEFLFDFFSRLFSFDEICSFRLDWFTKSF